jgi:hypothetical protein
MGEEQILEPFSYGSPAAIALLAAVSAAMLFIVVGTHLVSSYLRIQADRTAHYVPCLRCRRQIPPDADACPHCGRLKPTTPLPHPPQAAP